MKKSEKRMILIIVIVGVVIIGGILIWKNSAKNNNSNAEQQEQEKYVEVLDDGTKMNISSALKQNKTFDGYEMSNIQLTHEKGATRVIATVTNTTNNDKDLTNVELTLVDEKGNKLKTITGLISPVKAGESKQINLASSTDYANAYDFTITVKK